MRFLAPVAIFVSLGLWTPAKALAQDQPVEQPKPDARELFYTPPPGAARPAPAPARVATPQQPRQGAPAVEPGKENPTTRQAAQTPLSQARPFQPPPAASAGRVPLGLRYRIQRRNENGQFEETDPDTKFHAGDSIRIQMEANTDGYLYVVMQGSSGNWRLLFPSNQVAGGSNRIARGESRQIPPGDGGEIVFDEQAGEEKLFLLLSRQPEPDLDRLIYSMSAAPLRPRPGARPEDNRALLSRVDVGDELVTRLRGKVPASDLVVDRVDTPDPDGKPEKATYVVNPSAAPDAHVVADITLAHE